MICNQSQFGLHRPSLANRNLTNFQLFHDVDLEPIASQMSPNAKGSNDAIMEEKVEVIATREENPC